MTYKDFLLWVNNNTPEGADPDDFLEFLGMMGAVMFEQASKNSGKTVHELVEFAFAEAGTLYDA